MRKFTTVVMAMGMMALAGCTTAPGVTGANKNPNKPTLLVLAVVDLSDGSRLVGTPLLPSLKLKTDLMEADIPLVKIRQCDLRHKEKRVALSLQNGDQLTGILELNALPMETLLGRLVPPIEQIDRITFTPYQTGDQPIVFTDVTGLMSLEEAVKARGKTWTRMAGPIVPGAFVEDILIGRLNQPPNRGKIGKVISIVSSGTVAEVDFGQGHVVGVYKKELSRITLKEDTEK